MTLIERIAAIPNRIRCFICDHPSLKTEANAWDCTRCSTRLCIDDEGAWAAKDKPRSSLIQMIAAALKAKGIE